jgi:hypothetical protein
MIAFSSWSERNEAAEIAAETGYRSLSRIHRLLLWGVITDQLLTIRSLAEVPYELFLIPQRFSSFPLTVNDLGF